LTARSSTTAISLAFAPAQIDPNACPICGRKLDILYVLPQYGGLVPGAAHLPDETLEPTDYQFCRNCNTAVGPK
jgi:hypothetical protein